MVLEPPLLFVLHGSELLGVKIAHHHGISLAAHEERAFEDAEHKARPLQNVRGRSCFVLQSLHGEGSQSANDKLNRLLFFIATLNEASASRVSAVVPYLAYALKDRKNKPLDPVTMRCVAQLFEAMGTDSLLALEVHNPAAFQNAFRCPTEPLDSARLFVSTSGLRKWPRNFSHTGSVRVSTKRLGPHCSSSVAACALLRPCRRFGGVGGVCHRRSAAGASWSDCAQSCGSWFHPCYRRVYVGAALD